MFESDFDLEILSITEDELTAVTHSVSSDEVTSTVRVSMRKKDTNHSSRRSPSDIVLVIDTSGSMNDSASTTYVEATFNLLDIVIHAVKTVIGW
jgi:Mg-chelatase subunit ChlD